MAGLAGRGEMESSGVIVQTYRSINQLSYLQKMDYESFLQHEIKIREQWKLPAFTRL